MAENRDKNRIFARELLKNDLANEARKRGKIPNTKEIEKRIDRVCGESERKEDYKRWKERA